MAIRGTRTRRLTLVRDEEEDDGVRDARAFERCYRASYKRVYAYVYTITLSHDETEEVVSEAFLKAARSFARFDSDKASFTTWVCTIARNVAYSRMRTRGRRDEWTESELDYDLSRVPDQEEETHFEEDTQMAQKLLEVLSDEERDLVYLKFYRELSNKQIAEELSMNPSTVGTKISRAVAKMRKAAPSY